MWTRRTGSRAIICACKRVRGKNLIRKRRGKSHSLPRGWRLDWGCGWHTDFMTVINYEIIFAETTSAVLKNTWIQCCVGWIWRCRAGMGGGLAWLSVLCLWWDLAAVHVWMRRKCVVCWEEFLKQAHKHSEVNCFMEWWIVCWVSCLNEDWWVINFSHYCFSTVFVGIFETFWVFANRWRWTLERWKIFCDVSAIFCWILNSKLNKSVKMTQI
jgi:hypothetical protein